MEWPKEKILQPHQILMNDPWSVLKSKIDPPTDEKKSDRDCGNQHRVFHQRVELVLFARDAHFVQAKANVNQEHQHHRHPVIKLGEDDR